MLFIIMVCLIVGLATVEQNRRSMKNSHFPEWKHPCVGKMPLSFRTVIVEYGSKKSQTVTGEFHDQADAKWIVITGPLRGQ